MKGKHNSKPVFSVKEFVEYKKRAGAAPKAEIPRSIILCYSKTLSDRIGRVHRISEVRGILGNIGELYSLGDSVGLLANFGVGSPTTVLHAEELIGWGARRFVILGMAGALGSGLRIGDVVVCTKSIRDEGTSHHYVKHSKYAFSSRALTGQIHASLRSSFRRVFLGPSWTIDAPYMETVDELRQYRKEGILTVEMESSALFTVGRVRGAETAAVFVVSDILSEVKWKPRFRRRVVLDNLLRGFSEIKNILQRIPSPDERSSYDSCKLPTE